MSNEINLVQVATGTLDPGWWCELYDHSGAGYEETRVKGRFWTIVPEPDWPIGTGFVPQKIDLQITKVWDTVWVGVDRTKTYQRNVGFTNIGTMTAGWRALRAETDNRLPVWPPQ
jgi:hypothetical protein